MTFAEWLRYVFPSTVRVESPPADAKLFEIEDIPLTKDEDGMHLVNWGGPQPRRSSYITTDLIYKASRLIDREEFDRLRNVPRDKIAIAHARELRAMRRQLRAKKPPAGLRNRA